MKILSKVLKWCALSVATVFILGWLFVWLVASVWMKRQITLKMTFCITTR